MGQTFQLHEARRRCVRTYHTVYLFYTPAHFPFQMPDGCGPARFRLSAEPGLQLLVACHPVTAG